MEFNFQAGGGRRAKEEVAKALEVALTPLAQSFIEFAQSISELAKRERERADVAEGLNDSVFEARALDVTQWDEPIKHIAVMLNSETPQVQLQASTTLGDMDANGFARESPLPLRPEPVHQLSSSEADNPASEL